MKFFDNLWKNIGYSCSIVDKIDKLNLSFSMDEINELQIKRGKCELAYG